MGGSPGGAGPVGPVGPTGMDGHEGFTPTLLTNTVAGTLQYMHGGSPVEIMRQTVRAPGDSGALLVRAYIHGTVTKRAGIDACTVEVGLWRNSEPVSLTAQNVGVFRAPPDEVTHGFSGTLAHQIVVGGGELMDLRIEARRLDDDCTPPGGAGATPFAQVLAQIEVQFFRFSLLDR